MSRCYQTFVPALSLVELGQGAINAAKRCQCVPIGKGRTRPSSYTAKEFKSWRQKVADAVAVEMDGEPPLDGRCMAVIVAYWNRQCQTIASDEINPKTGKPFRIDHPVKGEANSDVDAMIKSTLDAIALGGGVIDDKQFMSAVPFKVYRKERPGLWLRFWSTELGHIELAKYLRIPGVETWNTATKKQQQLKL